MPSRAPPERRPTAAAPALASSELTARPHRRIFTAQDKLRIRADTDRTADTGGIAVILRTTARRNLRHVRKGAVATCVEIG